MHNDSCPEPPVGESGCISLIHDRIRSYFVLAEAQ
ncbi:hypothetical protein L585_00605 [Pantoea ananatis BRT175]|nr:hypothetical protein L585_00605 [Pantoea ananatis BRT175]